MWEIMIKKNKNMKYLIVLAVVLTSSCGVFTKLTAEQKKHRNNLAYELDKLYLEYTYERDSLILEYYKK